RAADRQEHKQNKRRFVYLHQTFTFILYSPARTGCESLFSDRSGRPRPPVVALMALVVGGEIGGRAPRAMAGTSRDKSGHDAPGAQRRDRHRRRPSLKAMTAA